MYKDLSGTEREGFVEFARYTVKATLREVAFTRLLKIFAFFATLMDINQSKWTCGRSKYFSFFNFTTFFLQKTA